MEIKEYLTSIGIKYDGSYSEDAYVIDLLSSDDYAKVYSILDRCDDLEELQDAQVITEESGSIKYGSVSQPYILDLESDWDADSFQLVVIDTEK